MNTSVSTRRSATLPVVPAGRISRWRSAEGGGQSRCGVALVTDVLVDSAPDHLSHRHTSCCGRAIDPGALLLSQIHLCTSRRHTATIYSMPVDDHRLAEGALSCHEVALSKRWSSSQAPSATTEVRPIPVSEADQGGRSSSEKAKRLQAQPLVAAYHQEQLQVLLEHVRSAFCEASGGQPLYTADVITRLGDRAKSATGGPRAPRLPAGDAGHHPQGRRRQASIADLVSDRATPRGDEKNANLVAQPLGCVPLACHDERKIGGSGGQRRTELRRGESPDRRPASPGGGPARPGGPATPPS